MGEIYRARDTRLGRNVAIKILSSKLSPNKQNLERFQQEACSASALNHPNIVTIFELGQVDTTYYMAMELVEGESLRAILTASALPVHHIIRIAAQVADGLAKAHEAGVVHRDLKPENLMISRDGLVKILDFGLAKLVAPIDEYPPDAETRDISLTSSGTLLGTIQYMSPEQTRGLQVDFRSDQFSLGSVLYEMATGRPAFLRRSPAETIAAILRDDPEPVSSLNPRVPAPFCWVIERCLAKKSDERYASTRDLARDLTTMRDRIAHPSAAHSFPRPNNLPVVRTLFVGRDREVKAVTELLLRQDINLLTLTGPGGIGKTRLALQVAAGLADNFPSGLCFVSLAAVKEAALVPSSIAQALGISESRKQAATQELKEHLHDLRTNLLIILDNFEHLLSAAPFVGELLAVSPNLKIVVTSRAPLHIYGEHEFLVPPLVLPDMRSATPEALSKNPCVALFLERAAAIKPNFALTKENASSVAAICARLDGLPLAIELAAARIKLLSPGAMEARLQHSLQLLISGAKDLPERQQTLRGTVDWSYNLLNSSEQALFRRLTVFNGGCTLEGVEAVCNGREDLGIDVLEGMASLVDKSLVRQVEQDQGESRFALLDTIREFGLERLSASGEEWATKHAHAAYCLVLAEEFAAKGIDPADTEWVNLFDVESDNFRAALEWLIQTGNAVWGMRLGTALFQFWETREYFTEGCDWLKRLLKLEGAKARTIPRARVLFSAGVLASEQRDYVSAIALMQESLDIARELHDARGVGIALNGLAALVRDSGDLGVCRALFEESLAVWRDFGDRVQVARSLSNLANIVKSQGDYALAYSLFEECLLIFRAVGDQTGIAWSLNYKGDMAREQGDAAGARKLYEESLTIFRELGDKWGMAGCLADLGTLACGQHDYANSRLLYAESMELFQDLGHKGGIARLLECLASSAVAQSKPERSLRLAGAAAALRRTLGAPLPWPEHVRLEQTLDIARHALPDTSAAAAWLDGWTAPLENAMEDALAPE
jgi:predicted ATPase/tRNA A-37 threonylcarbamoyl transferase component Bud32